MPRAVSPNPCMEIGLTHAAKFNLLQSIDRLDVVPCEAAPCSIHTFRPARLRRRGNGRRGFVSD
jgi:hypothetical protein